MKQLIVLLSTIILGIFIGAMVLGFKTDAKAMGDTTNTQLNSIKNDLAKTTACAEVPYLFG